MSFEVLPVVHVERRSLPEYPGVDPEVAFTQLARRFGRVVAVDVTGVRTNDADLEFLQTVARKRSLWMDAGSRYATDAMDLFVAGAETVTMRWNTLDTPDELEEAADLCQPGSLFLMLEFPRGSFLRHADDPRGAKEVAAWASKLGVGLTYWIERTDPAFLDTLPEGSPRYVQGASLAAAQALEERGFHGMLVAPSQLPPEGKP